MNSHGIDSPIFQNSRLNSAKLGKLNNTNETLKDSKLQQDNRHFEPLKPSQYKIDEFLKDEQSNEYHK